MESHSSKRLECRKCGTKFVHQKSYDQHQRAMCMGHRKRIAARKLQLPAMNPQSQSRKCFVCKYCSREYNYVRTIEIHIKQNHPNHLGETSDAYIIQSVDELNQNGEALNANFAITPKQEAAEREMESDIDSTESDGYDSADTDSKPTSVELGQTSINVSDGFGSLVKQENGDEVMTGEKGIKKLDGDNYTDYLVRNFLLNDSVENV